MRTRHALLLISFALTVPGPATARPTQDPAGVVQAWLDSLEIDPGVVAQLERYADEEGEWPEDSPDLLARALRDRVRADVQRAMARITAGPVEDDVRVNFLSPEDFARGAAASRDDRVREFQDGVIRTEQYHRFARATTSPTEALARFTDPQFRMDTSSRIESIEEEDGLSCIRTKGMWGLLDPTDTCNRITLLGTDGVAAEHSQVVSNPGDEDCQTIYFKESVKVFVATPDGLVLYYINYTRSSKLGALKKKLGRGKIEDSQRERAAALAERLDTRPD